MSEYSDEQLYRIANALEIIAQQNKVENETEIVASAHHFFAVKVNQVLDETSNEFELRRQLRKFTEGHIPSN